MKFRTRGSGFKESGISNNECQRSMESNLPVVSVYFDRSILKKMERSETTLRHSAIDIRHS
ncbi:hypothetical protein D1AOALGA4SA_2821 [Olavius algarvensis Delta 1 endosymbiont]|nr:hypothetical protein D1AOALGA4SA_2821 [Olavius algarvensis Delta 1 endosymbiont]